MPGADDAEMPCEVLLRLASQLPSTAFLVLAPNSFRGAAESMAMSVSQGRRSNCCSIGARLGCYKSSGDRETLATTREEACFVS